MSTCSSNCSTTYSKKRYLTFGIITIISLALPFIKIGGNHFFLLSFDKKQLHLLFTSFDMQELYLMPFLLILLFLGVFFITTLGGRVWCGWACPQTIFRIIYRDLIETKLLGIRKSIKNKQKPSKSSYKKIIAVSIWIMLSFLAAANFTWYFVPPQEFFTSLKNPMEHTVLLGFLVGIAGFLIYDIIFLKEDFCIYICPYARIQSVLYDDETIQTVYNENRGGKIYNKDKSLISTKPTGEDDECTGCQSCVTVCPTHIDIRKGMQLECINCLECADACTKVMGKLGKASLITWASTSAVEQNRKTQYIRFRTIAYGAVLSIALVALFVVGSTKEHMLLNINRTTQLYSIKDEGRVIQNAYIFLFQNTDSKDHTYYFEVDHEHISIKKPSKPFALKAGAKQKKIVILQADKTLSTHPRKDTVIEIIIKAYAMDERERVVVTRETNFIYPSLYSIEKQLSR